MLYSIVIPVYNGAASLEQLISEIRNYFGPEWCDTSSEIEVLLVDDSSSDESWSVIRALAARHSMIQPMRMAENVGQQKALYYGLLSARGTYAVTMDDDLQHDIRSFEAMHAAAEAGCDLVFGIYETYGDKGIRHLGSRLIGHFFKRHFPQLRGNKVSSYRLIHRSVYARLEPPSRTFVYLSADLLPYAHCVGNVTIKRRRRVYGKSGYTLLKCMGIGIRLNLYYGIFKNLLRTETHSELHGRR